MLPGFTSFRMIIMRIVIKITTSIGVLSEHQWSVHQPLVYQSPLVRIHTAILYM